MILCLYEIISSFIILQRFFHQVNFVNLIIFII